MFIARILVNVGAHNFDGYTPAAPLAEVTDHTGTPIDFHVDATDPILAAEAAFVIGNKMGPDVRGVEYPRDVRSLSVGDLVTLRNVDTGELTILACAGLGWKPLIEPTNPIVPLAGTRATSRVAVG